MIKFPKHDGSLTITHNEYKNYYETIEEYINESIDEFYREQKIDILDECIKQNSLWEMQVYPDTPIGFYIVYSPTFDGLFKQLEEE